MKVLMAMDVYLPDVDGVVNCMHNYCLVLKDKVDIEAAVPRHKKSYVDNLPYKITRCKSWFVPILNMYYGTPKYDRKFKKHLLDTDYDIIHIHSPFAMGKALVKIARKKNIPIIATAHTNFRPIFRAVIPIKPIYEAMTQSVGRFYNKLDEVLVVSPIVERQVRSFGYKGKISFMPFGTNTEKPADVNELMAQANTKFGIDKDETVFLFVGRITALKRIDFILKSLKILKDNGHKFRFFIVGKGIYEKKLRKLCKKLQFTDTEVIFTGFLDGLEKEILFARSDLFLFPSLYDNFGLVKVEAATFSTPGLFIKDSATADGVTDNVNGFVCDDNVPAFAARIEVLLKDKKHLKQVGKNACRDLYFNWRDCAPHLIAKYNEIIKTKEQKV